MSKLDLECGQAVHANKERILWVPGQSGIQGNEDAATLARKRLNNLFLDPEHVITISLCVG
jgi:hypothetical protein